MLSLSTCHNVEKVDEHLIGKHQINKKLNLKKGDPIDIEILKFTNSNHFDKDNSQGKRLKDNFTVLKFYQFDSSLQRMSVVFSYGVSPEILRKIFDPSTIPQEYEDTYKKLTFYGDRVLAFGLKEIDHFNMNEETREKLETGIKFLGKSIFSS